MSSDTPKATVDAWNLSDRVALLLLSKDEICAARVTDGEVDFLACAGALDCPGGTSCGWTTHATGGKDAKGRLVLKMKLPEGGGGGLCHSCQGLWFGCEATKDILPPYAGSQVGGTFIKLANLFFCLNDFFMHE